MTSHTSMNGPLAWLVSPCFLGANTLATDPDLWCFGLGRFEYQAGALVLRGIDHPGVRGLDRWWLGFGVEAFWFWWRVEGKTPLTTKPPIQSTKKTREAAVVSVREAAN